MVPGTFRVGLSILTMKINHYKGHLPVEFLKKKMPATIHTMETGDQVQSENSNHFDRDLN